MNRPKLTGNQIMDWRQRLGKPRRSLAERLDASPKTVEGWEYKFWVPDGPARRIFEQPISDHPADEIRP
jgi:DNA-binding transcriptional regulator YiaG